MPYHVTEPHPSVPAARSRIYFPTGIGGAGNIRSYNPTTLTSGPSATGPASLTSLTPPPTSAARMMTGRGGAGNVRKPTTTPATTSKAPLPARQSFSSTSGSISDEDASGHCAIFSFDEELLREQRMHDKAARVYIGRGGAGNAFNASAASKAAGAKSTGVQKGRAGSVASASSGSSNGSAAEARRRLGGVMDGIKRTLSRS